MQITGDEQGIAVLKEMGATRKDYLKFLLQEARTVFGNHVDYKAADGTVYRLHFNPRDGKLSVTKP